MFYQISFSPKVKASAIFSNKHGIYEFPYNLPNNISLRKYRKVSKISKGHRIIT